MPSKTFNNLPEEKRLQFINVALKEFSRSNFDTASINKIIKELGIARGSVYQYFENKLDLWLFLKSHAEQTKVKYIREVNRNEYDSFWTFYKAMYMHGIDFDLEEPLCSQFLYHVGFKEHSLEVKPYLDSWKKTADEMFTQMVVYEREQGNFDTKFSVESTVHFLITMSLSIAEYMNKKYKVDFDENIKAGKSLFAQNKKELTHAVNELIELLKKALS